MFRHEDAQKLDDPERKKSLPVDVVVSRLGLHPGARVADVGAGTGYFAIPMAHAVGSRGRVFAVDVQPEMLDQLRRRAEPNLPLAFVEGEATGTTLEGASVGGPAAISRSWTGAPTSNRPLARPWSIALPPPTW
jgi:SAM-dependent methyltransferase